MDATLRLEDKGNGIYRVIYHVVHEWGEFDYTLEEINVNTGRINFYMSGMGEIPYFLSDHALKVLNLSKV